MQYAWNPNGLGLITANIGTPWVSLGRADSATIAKQLEDSISSGEEEGGLCGGGNEVEEREGVVVAWLLWTGITINRSATPVKGSC